MWFDRPVTDVAHPRRPRRRTVVALLAATLAVLLGVVAVVATRDDDGEPVVAATTTTTVPPTTTSSTTTTTPPTEVPASTDLATPTGEVPVYGSPDGTEIGTVGFWYGYPMTMPIVQEAREGEWLRIMLPERPNGLTAWVKADTVTRTTSPWRMVVELGETRVHVYKDGFEVWSAPVGIGLDHTRTPTGSYFVAVIEKPGPAGYGPIVLNLNAHSEDIESWQGSGDAITAFHGPFGAEELIRSGGGKVSNGCIRMLPEDQIKMDGIALGSPVDIVA
jgi:lipoprotein-anchoring transpeptidase ErfK/SrfK